MDLPQGILTPTFLNLRSSLLRHPMTDPSTLQRRGKCLARSMRSCSALLLRPPSRRNKHIVLRRHFSRHRHPSHDAPSHRAPLWIPEHLAPVVRASLRVVDRSPAGIHANGNVLWPRRLQARSRLRIQTHRWLTNQHRRRPRARDSATTYPPRLYPPQLYPRSPSNALRPLHRPSRSILARLTGRRSRSTPRLCPHPSPRRLSHPRHSTHSLARRHQAKYRRQHSGGRRAVPVFLCQYRGPAKCPAWILARCR